MDLRHTHTSNTDVIYLWCSPSSARHTVGCGAGSWRCCYPATRQGLRLPWQQVKQPCWGTRLAPESGRNLGWQCPPTEISSSVYKMDETNNRSAHNINIGRELKLPCVHVQTRAHQTIFAFEMLMLQRCDFMGHFLLRPGSLEKESIG